MYEDNIIRYKFRKRNSAKKIRNLLFFVILFALGFYAVGFALQKIRNKNTNTTIISPLAEPFSASVEVVKKLVNPSQLREVVKKSLENTRGTYGIAIKNLKTEESYYLNENVEFESASLYKLWVMVVAFRQIESGILDQGEIIAEDIKDLNEDFDISLEDAELKEGKLELSIERAINQMIVVSNNYAALALTKKVKLSNVEKFLRDGGFAHSHTKSPPTTSASDIALFYEKLYTGQLAGKESTEKMIEILKNQQLNDRLPKYLPEKIEVAHKTGELDKFKHDAGIVFTQKGDYILVVLSESDNAKGAAERIAQLSKNVFEYFQKRD